MVEKICFIVCSLNDLLPASGYYHKMGYDGVSYDGLSDTTNDKTNDLKQLHNTYYMPSIN